MTSLVQHERIRTTLAKAKEVQRHADRAITWAKLGSHQYHVKAAGYLRSTDMVKKLFSVLGPRYAEREGGYTRILRAGFRAGDRAEMAILEYVDRPGEARPARPPATKVVAEEAAPEPLVAKVARLAEQQKAVIAGAKALPGNLLPSFPSPSPRPLRFADMDSLPAWKSAQERAQAKTAAARRRKSKREQRAPIDVARAAVKVNAKPAAQEAQMR